jgi:hypothetical protein
MGIAARPILSVIAAENAFHGRYLALAAEIERRFPVAQWRSGDVDIWPLARMDLYLDMYWQQDGVVRPQPHAFPLRMGSRALRPLINIWKSRSDLSHFAMRPRRADAIFLGDGVSLDRVDGAWEDRFCEPVMAALEQRGRETFLMQSGNLSRLPWRRRTFAANTVGARGWLESFASSVPVQLPGRDDVVAFLAQRGVAAPSLDARALAHRAHVVSATATAFERVLRVVAPRIAFVVTYYAQLGHAFVLACRRQGILSVDLQHDPQAGAHEAYSWDAVPECGYRTLPALFWNWSQEDSAVIRRWSDRLPQRWHQSLVGGHTQLARFLSDSDPATRELDARFRSRSGTLCEREILVALQPIGGRRAVWEALAAEIEAAPPGWRWWIRRHPASHPVQDAEFGRLLSLKRGNVMIEPSSEFPLPTLLRHMSVVLSLCSGAAAEGAMFGVPSIFLSEEARASLGHLIARGQASIVPVKDINSAIARLPVSRMPYEIPAPRPLNETLARLDAMASDYAALCRGVDRIGRGPS